ncbi:nicotinate-nucleotide adenylyltransferase [Salimicrobium album]|uniref:Probable nicotinate-nucleotide adenylyltransferase n=1 Tax=Salimicrobium album TaxID=50717 RepID=A0A1H3DLP7_9BACI|nr:nicotinate-nucleotide adenylyltransferase [Salimicrobium album]SDX67301.1 nicotinate-nucleotide adenylyltransferase [Salimicrobium album]
MEKIGLFGGTFDPLHIGHMILAEAVREAWKLEEIWFIPSHLPPHKEKASVSGRDRMEMVRESISQNDKFKVCDLELLRGDKSYTLKTVRELKERYPDKKFFFIIGGDMVESLGSWYHIEELMEEVSFVGVNRPGYSFGTDYPVSKVEIPPLSISSSEIRERMERNLTIRYMVPEPVYFYIKRKGLYEHE